jgi:hypothetical protein
MASGNVRSRPIWFWPLVAFLVGLLIGWLVIGWALWPVTWKNTLPQDLRPAERDAYLEMVAGSLAANGDIALAQERLATWPNDELVADLRLLQQRLAGEDPLQAEQVQALASALGLQLSAAVPGQPASSQPSAGGSLLSSVQWRTVLTTGLWVLLILLGVGAVVLLYRRWRGAHERDRAPAISSSVRDEHVWSPVGTGTSADVTGGASSAGPELVVDSESGSSSDSPPWDVAELDTGEEAQFAPLPPSSAAEGVDQPAEAATATAAAAAGRASAAAGAPVPSGSLTKITEVRALYEMGEPDYDEAFDVKDSSGAYIGECGVALVDPIGRGHDQAAALQVWLWDKTDPDTKVKVLMGEGAYRDTALRDQLAKDQPSVAVKPEATFELDSYNLLLRGTVEKLDYADLEPAYGVFAELQLLLQVFRKG